jgi:6-pyruvoyltetrahydropterin/6-carboxytetrahydropterin synthase
MENIAILIWNKLRDKLEDDFKISVTLYETPRNYAVYNGE